MDCVKPVKGEACAMLVGLVERILGAGVGKYSEGITAPSVFLDAKLELFPEVVSFGSFAASCVGTMHDCEKGTEVLHLEAGYNATTLRG